MLRTLRRAKQMGGAAQFRRERKSGEKNGPFGASPPSKYVQWFCFSILRVYVVQSHLPGLTSQTLRDSLHRPESVCTFVHCGRDHVGAETKLFRGLTQLSAIQMLFLKSYYKKKKYVVDMYDYKKQRNKETRCSLCCTCGDLLYQ